MDYTHIRLTGLNTVDLAIQDAAHDDAFLCKGIDGLGPAEIDVSISGEHFQNKVPRNKQIIIRIGLNPFWQAVGATPSSLRETLYGLLTGGYTGDRVGVILMDIDPVTLAETEVARIYGYISKFETVPFSKDPQVQITIDCLSAYLVAPVLVEPNLLTLDKTSPDLINSGTGPTGFHMKFTFAGLGATLPYFEITQLGNRKMRFDPPSNFANGDSIEFSTNYGERFITLVQGGSTINGLPWLTTDSEWLQLYGGSNVLEMSSNLFNWNVVEFLPKFWGV